MKKPVTWADEAKTDIRRIRKEQALVILKALAHFAREGVGGIRNSRTIHRIVTACAWETIGCSRVSRRTAPFMS